MSKVGNPCPTLGRLPASRILYALLVGENSTKSPRQDFVHSETLSVLSDAKFRLRSIIVITPFKTHRADFEIEEDRGKIEEDRGNCVFLNELFLGSFRDTRIATLPAW